LAYSAVSTSDKGTTLAWTDRKGTPTPLPGPSRQSWGNGRLSPDGRHVVNAIRTDQGWDIWVLDVTRGTLARLTAGGTSDEPVWTPDGRDVAYASSADGTFGINLIAADGSGKPRQVLRTRTRSTPDSFTPDGKTLFFDEQESTAERQIYVTTLTADGRSSEPTPVHQGVASGETDAEVSPTGQWLAYESKETGENAIYVQPFPGPGPKVRVSERGGEFPRWSRDGRELYYWVDRSELMAVGMRDGALGTPVALFRMLTGVTFDVGPSRDQFLVEMVLTPGGSTIATVANWFTELRKRAPVQQ
jgi:Tol biopolymer transport system component